MSTTGEDKERINILLEEYKNQDEWQRHNESQRAQLTTILFTISAALVALLAKDRPLNPDDWPIPTLLVVIGIFGILSVEKYWERFRYHVRLEEAHRVLLDTYFPDNLLINTRKKAVIEHDESRRLLLKDKYVMQHWLWNGIFVLVILAGTLFWLRASGLA